MPTKIETKTNELCEAILQEIQTGGIRQRIDTFLSDATARGAYESLMSRGQASRKNSTTASRSTRPKSRPSKKTAMRS